jgi:steroid 5-alpha reductase family enzyme
VQYVADIFCLIVLAAGWYYIFYSPAAHRLHGIEDVRLNALRIGLRRVNGVIMMLLATALFASMHTVGEPHAAAWVFMGIIILMSLMVTLALVDLQLTRKLKERRKKRDSL